MQKLLPKIAVVISAFAFIVSVIVLVVANKSGQVLGEAYRSGTTRPLIVVSSQTGTSSILNSISVGTSTPEIAASSTFPNTKLAVDTELPGYKGLVIRGVPNQTANLQEWLAANGTTVAYMDINGNLSASGTFAFGGTGTTTLGGGIDVAGLIYGRSNLLVGSTGSPSSTILGSLNLGNGTPNRANQAGGSLYVTGNMEVDGTTNFDEKVTFNGATFGATFNSGIKIIDSQAFVFGTGSDAEIFYNVFQTPDSLNLTTSADSNALLITEDADLATDFAHPLQANPTIFIQSADATKKYQFGSFAWNALSLTTGAATTTISANSTSTFGGGIAPTSTANNTLDLGGYGSAWRNVFASGTIYGTITKTITLTGSYSPATGTKGNLKDFVLPFNCTVTNVIMNATSTLAGQPTVIDVNYQTSMGIGTTTLFTTQGERPQLDAGGFTSSTVPDVTALSKGNVLNFDIDQLGGHQGLDVQILCAGPSSY